MRSVLLAIALCLACVETVSAQKCTTSWPYLYWEFTSGTVYFVSGTKANLQVNIHVERSTLHFLDGEDIKEALANEVVLVEIGQEKYYSYEGYMMKVVGGDEKGFVAVVQLGDVNSVHTEGTAAYGASSNSSAIRKMKSIEVWAKTNHLQMRKSREEGYDLPLIKKYYLVTNGTVYLASKAGLEEKLEGSERDELKAFLKKTKIGWKNPNDLVKLIDFLNR